MANAKVKSFLLGTILAGSMNAGLESCSDKDTDDNAQPKTEVQTTDSVNNPHDNIALFENSRSDIKFALAFVENYYPYVYYCGERWTAGHGLTILYNADGSYKKVTKDTKPLTLNESDMYNGRYLTFEVLKDIKNCITVPMDKNTLLAACALRYCIGGPNFRKSTFLRDLNAGKTGAALAKNLTGWRQQHGVLNRCYFFAALMCGKIDYTDLLDLRAEGCYNLTDEDMFICVKGKPKRDKQDFFEWDFSKIQANLQKAKQPRKVKLKTSMGTIYVECKLTKEIVPDYIWQEVSSEMPIHVEPQDTVCPNSFANAQNDSSYIAYLRGDYRVALEAGKKALKSANTNKQRGAACYNIGICYLASGKYNEAIKYLEQSNAYNQTNAAQKALDEAKQKKNNNNKIMLIGVAFGAVACAAWTYGRKKYIGKIQKQR